MENNRQIFIIAQIVPIFPPNLWSISGHFKFSFSSQCHQHLSTSLFPQLIRGNVYILQLFDLFLFINWMFQLNKSLSTVHIWGLLIIFYFWLRWVFIALCGLLSSCFSVWFLPLQSVARVWARVWAQLLHATWNLPGAGRDRTCVPCICRLILFCCS